MADTMEQYMSKTQANYESGISRPKINDKDSFELKGQFLKELRDNTRSCSDHEDANEHIEKDLEIVDLFHIPNITQDQVMLRAFPMSLTGAASRWLRNNPSGSITTWEDLKTEFLSKYCPPTRTAKKMEEINNFQQETDETIYQAWERFKELLMKCHQHYLTEMHEVILFYNRLDVQTRQILDSKGAIPSKTVVDAKVAIQEMAEYSKKWHYGTSRTRSTKTSNGLAAIQAQINNLGREIKKERGFGSLPSSTESNPRDHVKSISTPTEADSNSIRHIRSPQYAVSTPHNKRFMFESRQMTIPFPSRLNDYYCEEKKGSYGPQFSKAYSYETSHIDKSIPQKEKDPRSLGKLAHTKLTVELVDRTVKYPKGIAKNMLVGIGKFVFPIDFIILDMPKDVKVPLILRRPFLSTAYAKIDVFKRKITLRVGDEKIIFKSVKPASSFIKRVYMLSLRERMELDLEARLMGETLVLNRSLDPVYGDYIELNDLNVPLELRRDQVDHLMPTIEEGEVIEEFRARNDARMVSNFFGYPNDFDHDKKIRISCPYNMKFSCMIDFAVLVDMDAYRDEGMGDVIFGKPFLREVGINARRFEGIIPFIMVLTLSSNETAGYVGFVPFWLVNFKAVDLKFVTTGRLILLEHKGDDYISTSGEALAL
ncbi:putative reverse transcriptase domain-containing protein [Tanacetum coccineum]